MIWCGDTWKGKGEEEIGMMKQANQWKLGAEKEEKCWNTWLQKAVRQNSLIIDAYNSRQKLKIDDKCTEADDVIHCIHHSDLDMLDVDCRFITSVSQIPNSPFSVEFYA